ncbi:MAG: FAD binding domain-containing protein [Deltaproteobacteria bacterium]|nr:FAD binding domain-containing protein [Deltaproteobacteria bacterium]
MRLGSFEHLAPESVEEACSLLARHAPEARVLAGGTDLLVRMKQGVAGPRWVVSLKKVEGLGNIGWSGGELRLGAAVPLRNLHRSAEIRERYPILAEAALGVGAAQLQNMGTVGGNLCLEPRCWYYQQGAAWRQGRTACFKLGGDVCLMAKGSGRCHALYSGDTAAALLALDARVRLVRSGGERTLPLSEFFVDDGLKHTVLREDELLAEVVVPAEASGRRGAYLKYRKRGTVDFPIVGVGVTAGEDVRIAVTGAGSAPLVVQGTGELTRGRSLTAELVEELAEAARSQAKPVSHMEVSAPYRRRLVRVLVKDALDKLLS